MGNDVEIGRVTADQFADFRRVFNQTFGFSASEEELARIRPWTEVERAVVARAGDQIVGTSGAYSFDLALPWADPVGCAGITVVSVRTDHRRRGVLTRMMRQLFEDAYERGEPYAALWASEAPIYGRFGFGPAAPTIELEVPRSHGRLRRPVAVDEVRLVDRAAADAAIPALYEAFRRQRHGMLGLPAAWWERILGDESSDRDGASEKFYALIPDRGFAIYRLKSDWSSGHPAGTVQLQELIGLDPEATAMLWQFLLDIDLSGRVRAHRRPVDDPLPLLLANEGRADVKAGWPLQVCLLDLPVALAARGYGVDDTITLRVHDAFQPHNDGTWRLAVSDGKAVCEPAGTDAADVEFDAEVLAALVLGGHRASRYAAAGRLQAHTPGAVARTDRLFATDVAPWHGVMF